MIADGAVAIIGGRNIGDEYFEIGETFYVDMDALAVGQIVPQTAATCDAYWNSASAFAVEDIISGTGDRAAFDARVSQIRSSPEAQELMAGLENSVARYASGQVPLEWTRVQLVADDPVKGQGIARRDRLMIARLAEILGSVEKRLDLVSAYFIPGVAGTEYFTGLAAQGKEVSILTNALNTTDVLLVHSGYTKYRRKLLKAGVHLYELKLRGGVAPESET